MLLTFLTTLYLYSFAAPVDGTLTYKLSSVSLNGVYKAHMNKDRFRIKDVYVWWPEKLVIVA
jgi:hypothetical protein